MGLADVLKPKMPRCLSTDIMTDTELSERSFDEDSGTIGVNPESLCIALEDTSTSSTRREALAQLINHTSVD